MNGTATSADLAGHLVIQVEAPDGSRYIIDLGLAHALAVGPVLRFICASPQFPFEGDTESNPVKIAIFGLIFFVVPL